MSVFNENVGLLDQAIQSILKQTYRNIELIVVLDNPNNIEAKQYLLNHSHEITLICNETNIGLAKSLNKGIAISNGSLIARMDADDISLNNRIEIELDFLLNNDYDLVVSDIQRIDEQGNPLEYIKAVPKDIKDFEFQIKHRNCVAHPTYLFKKDMFKDIGGYKNLKYAQDYELVRNIYSKGYKIGFLQNEILFYRVRENSISNQRKAEQYFILDYIRTTYNNKRNFNTKYIEECLNGTIDDYRKFRIDFNRYLKYRSRSSPIAFLCVLRSKYIFRHFIHVVFLKVYFVLNKKV